MTGRGEIELGDIIEAVDGRAVSSFGGLINVLDGHDFGDRITLTVRRGDQEIKLNVTLSGSEDERSTL